MLSASKEGDRQTSSVFMAQSLSGLGDIHNSACPAVIWERALDQRVQAWLEQLNPANLPKARVIICPQDIAKTLLEICVSCHTPSCEERQIWIEDVVMLANKFVELTSASYLRLRLDVVTTNACKKFHIDYLTARLVCTYRGRGTEYGYAIDGAVPEATFNVPTGAPFLMRGKHWPNTPASNLQHRSPAIEGTGETRLVMVFDPVDHLPVEGQGDHKI